MESVITNEKDERFIELSRELDNEYFMKLGDIVKKYEEYNDLADPHIVILALLELGKANSLCQLQIV